jgi:inosine/xanthosine triphosphatase
MRAAIGSTNPTKIAAARCVMRRIFGAGVEVIAVPVTSEFPAQPWGDVETRRGAIERARTAIGTVTGPVNFGLGLEGGVLELESENRHPELYTSAWCAVVDGAGTLGLGGGANLLLPSSIADAVRAGEELGVVISRFVGETGSHHPAGAIGALTGGWLNRQEAFEQVLTLALARFLNPRAYLEKA